MKLLYFIDRMVTKSKIFLFGNIEKKYKSFIKGRFLIALFGALSLIWFLVRVIPKPSRAMYPCQRAAFPVASAFVIWIIGFIGTFLSYNKARYYFKKSKFISGLAFTLLAIVIFGIMEIQSSLKQTFANGLNTQQLKLNDTSLYSNSVSPKATVAIVKSDKANASDIDSTEIYDMVRQAVNMAGGFDTLIHDNSVVVLKPNLIATAQLDNNFNPTNKILSEKINSVTTDYRVIQGVVNLVRGKNPHGKIYIMEGSGIGKTRDNMSKMGWLRIKGVDDFICLDEACGAWRDTTAKELVKVSLPEGKALYKAAQNIYYLNKIYFEADVLISIPVLKNHSNAAVTGAVKNVGIGATPVNIYGASASKHWRVDVIDHRGENFANLHNWIHDFYMCRPVNFAIMDGLTGMEHGPTPLASDPISLRKKNTRCILASKDPVALDAIESLIVQVDPSKVRHLVKLHNDNMGCADPKYLRVRGVQVDKVKGSYSNIANYANYSDFASPNISIKGHQLSQDSLSLKLNVDVKVVKVEIAVDDIFIDQIIVKNFENFTVKLGKAIKNEKQVKIYAYDHFLNCSGIFLDGTSIKISVNKIESKLD